MDASPDLHLQDLSAPSPAWLGRLLGFRDLKEALANREGPALFAEVSSLEEFRRGLGLPANAPLKLLRSAHSVLPPFLQSMDGAEFTYEPDRWSDQLGRLEIQDASETLIVFLQNPTFFEGRTLSPDFLASLLRDFAPQLKKWQRTIFISDESLGSFAWDVAEDPTQVARLPAPLVSDWEIFVCLRPSQLLGPESESSALLWPVERSRASWNGVLMASPVAWKLFRRDLNQGIEIVRFRHLAMRNLKLLGNLLAPLVQRGKIRVDHWPLSGFYVSFHCPDRGSEDSALLRKRLEKTGVRLSVLAQPPGQVSFCFVLDQAPLRQGLEKLAQGLELL
jgi:hypothetical protein